MTRIEPFAPPRQAVRWAVGAGITGALALASLVPLSASAAETAPPAETAGTTFYVDNQDDSNCDDSGPGTSADAPWCTFDPVNERTLGPGDSVLLARGATWKQNLEIAADGTAEHPVLVSAYGEGADPRIGINATGNGVHIVDPDHLTLSRLDIGAKTSMGTSGLNAGVLVETTTLGHEGLVLEDLVVHDNRWGAIRVINTADVTPQDTALSGLVLRRIETTGNGHGIEISNSSDLIGTGALEPGSVWERVFTDVLVEDVYLHGDDNNNPDPSEVFTQIDLGCPDALAVSFATDVVIRDSVLDGAAACRTLYGTTAIFLGRMQHALVANNMIVNTPNVMTADQVAIDHEALTHDITVAGNYIADNYGGGIEYLAIHGAEDFSTGNATIANTFVRNGYTHLIPYPGGGAIAQVGNGVIVETTIADNLSYEPYGLLTAKFGGSTEDFTVSNNKQADAAEDIANWAASYGEPDSDWNAQVQEGASWRDLAFDASDARYGTSTASVDRFGADAADDAVAMVWTAPEAGVVSVRGFALALQDTATVAVLRNDQQLAAVETDESGDVISVDGIAVKAGQRLRFVVSDAPGGASFVPSVAYTSDAASADALGEWTFSVDGDVQGWNAADATVSDGALRLTADGAAVTATSPQVALSAAASGRLRIAYANDSEATSGRVLFTTSDDEDFDAERSVAFSINPKGTAGLVEGTSSVVVPLAGAEGWEGVIDRIRIEFDDVDGAVALSEVQFTAAQYAAEFDAAEGWTYASDISCPAAGTPSANPEIDIDNTAGDFQTAADLSWTSSRQQDFTVSTPRLARIDLWAYKTGDPLGCLFLRVVKITDEKTHRGEVLFTGGIAREEVTTDGGYVSIFPGLDGLDTNATYALQVYSPYTIPGTGAYGVGYSDDTSLPLSGGERSSSDANGTWSAPEDGISLQVRTYSAASIASARPEAWDAVNITDGWATGPGGYEPALLSPADLELDAEDARYLHIRMTNPDDRPVAYVLFTTEEDQAWDTPRDGFPPSNEQGKGLGFALVMGDEPHEYVLDMSTAPGWTGTITQLMIEPSFRYTYRISDLNSTWNGAIDYVRLDSAATSAEEAEEPGAPTTPTPTPGDQEDPDAWAQVQAPDAVEQGGTLTVTVTGLEPGQQIAAVLHSDPLDAGGIAPADADGTTSFRIAIPDDFALGAHTLVVSSAGLGDITTPVDVVRAGALATTGVDVAWSIIGIAVLLLALGGLLALRRRRGLQH